MLARSDDPHPHDAHLMEFTNPISGGPVMATISAFARLVPAGVFDPADAVERRHGARRGRGRGSRDDRRPGTAIVARHDRRRSRLGERSFRADGDLVLFAYSDRATQEKLGLWREALG